MHFSLHDESKPPLEEDDIYLYSKESPLQKHNSKDFDEYYIEGKSQNKKPKSKIANNNAKKMSMNNHAVKYEDSGEDEYRELNVEYSDGNIDQDAHDNQSKHKRAKRKGYLY